MQEKRRYFRYVLESPVVFKVGEKTIQGTISDLSYLGIGGYANEKMAEGDHVRAEIASGVPEPLKFDCQVKYVKETAFIMGKRVFRVGLEFVNTEKSAVTYLMRTLQEQMSAEARKKGKFF